MARRAGIAVPLFSVFSKDSVGIGELGDLPLLVDFCRATGNSVLQLLPLFELGPDHSPYNPISLFALEPAYVTLQDISGAEGGREEITRLREKFPAGKGQVNYGVKQAKIKVLREIYRAASEKERLAETADFRKKNRYWIEDYARFKETESDFWIWVQYQLYLQLMASHDYARKRGVRLLGDLPYSVGAGSADFCAYPGVFEKQYVLGAPPDLYSVYGQRWGTLPYDFEKINKDGHRYLLEKIHYQENFFDVLRIDHVLGYFRQWRIRKETPKKFGGLSGSYDLKAEKDWRKRGERLLRVIKDSTKIELVAEDLGMTPAGVKEILEKLLIPGTDVARWTREYRGLGVSMLSLHDTTNFPAWWNDEAGTVDRKLWEYYCRKLKLNVAGVEEKLFDLRDSAVGRLRWRKEIKSVDRMLGILKMIRRKVPHLVQMYKDSYGEREMWWEKLGMRGPVARKWNEELLVKALTLTLQSHCAYCINTIVDWFFLTDIFADEPEKYRINTPGSISQRNWSLRIPVPLEKWGKLGVIGRMKLMIADAGRV